MIIDRIDLFHVAMPLVTPWRTAYGEDSVIESVLCRMVSGEHEAWGESCPLASPTYRPEWAGGVFATTKRWLAPRLIGQEIASGEDLQNQLAIFKGNSFAKAALDNTWWALKSEIEGEPLHKLLGAKRDAVPVGADFGVRDSVAELLGLIQSAVDQRFPRIKLKYRPGWDLEMLRQVRDSFPDVKFHIDCNSGYRLNDLDMFRAVDEFHLEMIEQPLQYDDLSDHAKLQKEIRTPVCLDESIDSVEKAKQAIELRSCKFVNIKPGRVGGLTNAVAIHDLCKTNNIPCWVGGMLESSVGVNHCIALAMLDNCTYPADIFPSSTYYKNDLGAPRIDLTFSDDGVPHVLANETLPIPNSNRLKECTLDAATLE